MKSLLTLILLIANIVCGIAQTPDQKHVVFLKNKDNNPYSLSNPGEFLTQRSLDRRARYGIILDEKDLPVTPSYVAQIAATGASVIYPLKWFNAVVIMTFNPSVLAAIAALPFVDHIDQVVPKNPGGNSGKAGINRLDRVPPYTLYPAIPSARIKSTGSYDYGMAYNQAHMIKADGLHNLGFSGEGMIIAVLDAGFFHVDQIAAFDSLWLNNRILGTRDFHLPGNNVFGDDMHTHGTSVLSTMGANLPGQMVGTAPHASYWLIRTEVGDYEALIEEYNWAGGAEFADSLGVDVINSSLGYTTFDNPVYDHTYADMDGNTTPVTRAADLAAGRGLLVVNSAGNEGSSSWHFMGAPADGDSVFAIGAVNSQGIYASFSSTGPTYDGRIKPDVVAQGENTTVVSGWGAVQTGSGTSFSSPVMAGGLTCLWQSMKLHSAQEIRNAVRNTASRAADPDSLYGYGIPDLVNARVYLSTLDFTTQTGGPFNIYPNPFRVNPIILNKVSTTGVCKIEIINLTGQIIQIQEGVFHPGEPFVINGFEPLPAGIYFIRISTSTDQGVLRAVKL
ncbi:MAG: S8 family serine peptidase [Bacteroidales bacterium]|nr:S8 family serine peptidase [Bacteroidales bacterium]HNW72067.1 S8 family serine peptidase [Bacteroidales bacterium]HPS49108.1 S8 family serine peptidase [Bacteroidales bacterium]